MEGFRRRGADGEYDRERRHGSPGQHTPTDLTRQDPMASRHERRGILPTLLLGVLLVSVPRSVCEAAKHELKLVVRSDKAVYGMSEKIELQAELWNTAEMTPETVYGWLQWGYLGGLLLHVEDEKGVEVERPQYDDALIPPNTLEDERYYVSIQPGHALVVAREDDFQNLTAGKAGKYKLWIEYRSPVPRHFAKVNPFMAREDGTLTSAPIWITVEPETPKP